MIKKILGIILITISSASYSDVIYLKNGTKIEGDIKQVSEDEITVEVPIKGFEGIYKPHTIKRKDIKKIKQITDMEIPKVEQNVEGKVFYRGKWITPEEKDKIEKEWEEQFEVERESAKEKQKLYEKREKELEIEKLKEEYKGTGHIFKGKEVHVYMSKDEVKELWGKPDAVRITDYGYEYWYYKSSSGTEEVQFYENVVQEVGSR